MTSKDYEFKLNREWRIFCNMTVSNARYEDYLKELGVFKTIQQFWRFFNFFKTSIDIPNGSSLSIFRSGSCPRWEDYTNRNGGRWILDVEDSFEGVMEIWIKILVYIIGEKLEFSEDINGSLISRRSYDNADGRKFMIYIWTKSTDTEGRLEAINRILPQNLNANVHFKAHNPSNANINGSSQSPSPKLSTSIDHSDIVSPFVNLSKMDESSNNKEPIKAVGLYQHPFKRSSSTSVLEIKSKSLDDSTDSDYSINDSNSSINEEEVQNNVQLEKDNSQNDTFCNLDEPTTNSNKQESKENNIQHVIINSLKKKKRKKKNKSSSQLITSSTSMMNKSASNPISSSSTNIQTLNKNQSIHIKQKPTEVLRASILVLVFLAITLYFVFKEKKSILKQNM